MSGGSESRQISTPYSTSYFRPDRRNVNHLFLYRDEL